MMDCGIGVRQCMQGDSCMFCQIMYTLSLIVIGIAIGYLMGKKKK